MPQIASLPIDEPVAKPQASPAQFGSVGETIAGLGEETEQLALGNQAFEAHLIYAQRQLKLKQVEIQVGALEKQAHIDLEKARTPEEAQAIKDHFQGEIHNTLSPLMGDRFYARVLSPYGQQIDVEMQSTTNAKKADIITKSTRIADATLGQTYLNEGINSASAGGNQDTYVDKYRMQLQASAQAAARSQAEVDADVVLFKHDLQKGVILTKINSGDPGVRQYAIKQLSNGGGELEHSSLSAEEINQLRTHAVDTDHSLSEKEEAGNLNGALNISDKWFSSQEYKHPDGTPDDEAIEKALSDGKQLVEHGIVTPDGKPNFVMADKLDEHYSRLWQLHQKVQRDKDEAVLEKYSPKIYDPKHPMTIAQIEALPQTDGASSRAVNQLKTALFQEQRNARVLRNEERGLSLQERAEKRRELEDRSIATSLTLADRMAEGDVLDYNNDILTPISKGQMTESDGAKVWHMYKDSDQYPEIGEGIGIIGSVFKALPNTSENNRKAADARDSFLNTVKAKNLHGSDILKEAQNIADQTGKAATGSFITNLWDSLTHGGRPSPVQPVMTAPTRPSGVPDNAVWNPATKTWQLQQQ